MFLIYFQQMDETLTLSGHFADVVVPQEYGCTKV